MTFTRRPELAQAAAFELASREKYYPAMLAAAEIARDDAAQDLDCWRAIATMLDAGSAVTDCSWGQLALATSRALVSRCEACDAKPGDRYLEARRDAVQEIHNKFAWHHWFMTGMRGPRPTRPAPALQLQEAA